MTLSQPDPVVLRNRTAYGRIAAEWERRRSTDYDQEFHDRCRAEFLKYLPGRRVLDLGCGLGLDSLEFARAGLGVVATDIAVEFLSIVQTRGPAVPVVAADMTRLCFRPASFDGVFAMASLLHVPHPLVPGTLAAFSQLLAPEGVLFLHHVQAADGRQGYQIDDLLIRDNPALCFCHPPEQLSLLLAQAGLQVLLRTDLRPSRYPSESAARNGLAPYQLLARKASSGRR